MARTKVKTTRSPIIVALDAPWRDSCVWLSRLKGQVWGFKLGSILYSELGPGVIEKVQNQGFRVFLDLKFHDIPNTVERSVRTAFSWGVNLLTVHASGGRSMLEAAASYQRRGQSILAVTVLTSLDAADLRSIGVHASLTTQVQNLADLAINAGIKGLVCSPREVASLRARFKNAILLTPGVRFAGPSGDQKRTETLRATLDSGATYAVVGRALTEAKNWKDAWQKLISSTDETS